MSDPTDPGGVTGGHERGARNSTRVGDSGSPVGSPLTIVLAVIAVAAGFLIFRSISDDSDAGGVVPTSAPAGAGVSTLPTGANAPAAGTTPTTTPTGGTPALTREGAVVVVANASGADGAADVMKAQLAEVGYTMGESVSDNSDEALATSVVYFDVGNATEAVAQSVAVDMGGLDVLPMPSPIPVEPPGTIDGAVLVMLGSDLALEDLPDAPPAAPAAPSVAATTPTTAG